jgi:hypothetical protein
MYAIDFMGFSRRDRLKRYVYGKRTVRYEETGMDMESIGLLWVGIRIWEVLSHFL